ncbi:MAG: copper resistance protein B [Bdellovibrionales bacterium]|nr:copper resistance protein B [Bdellovibrionales bacterium]
MNILKQMVGAVAVILLSTLVAAQEPDWHAANQYYDATEMAAAKHHLLHHHGAHRLLFLEADRLEYQSNDGESLAVWDAQGYYGTDFNKLWLKSEGDYQAEPGKLEEAELQLLYGRSVSPYFDLQLGMRHDFEPRPVTTYGVLGAQGLAPLWFEIDTAAFLSEKGDVTVRVESEYDLLLTQRLILQPRLELEAAAQDVEALGLGSGLTAAELGVRLRYEVDRHFAPYLGVVWQDLFAGTADRAGPGEGSPIISCVAGVRAWY